MKELFRKTTASIIISSIAAFIIGLIMVLVPDISLQAIGIIVGIYIIVHGIVLITLSFTANKFHTPFFGVMSGILSIIIGLILLAMPNILSTIFAIALGIWIILSSVDIINVAIVARKAIPNWVLLLILGIIDLVVGVIILFNPFASSVSIMIIAGIVIMVHSIVTVIDMIMIRKDTKDIAKVIEANVKTTK
ncbi:DUF308 domain-containing protein [Candidatus Saccharibacteria bacterium]|nr:DUF308 domain-containing protein [Candidatus Saccharibacteria bacterium]